MFTRKALFAVCLATVALTASSAWAGGFSFGFSYNGAPRYYYPSYYAPSYVYYDTSPVYYVDPAPAVVYAPAPPVVYYTSPTVIYRDVYPRYYRGATIYSSGYGWGGYGGYGWYGHSRYSYRHFDHSPRIRAGVRVGW